MNSTAPVAIQPIADASVAIDPRLLGLKQMVVDAVTADNSKRDYGKALDHHFAFAAGRPLTRELLLEWRASMEKLAPSTANIRLSAMRSLAAELGSELDIRSTHLGLSIRLSVPGAAMAGAKLA